MGEWWNGIHATLKMLCSKGMRVQVPPRPLKERLSLLLGFLFSRDSCFYSEVLLECYLRKTEKVLCSTLKYSSERLL